MVYTGRIVIDVEYYLTVIRNAADGKQADPLHVEDLNNVLLRDASRQPRSDIDNAYRSSAVAALVAP